MKKKISLLLAGVFLWAQVCPPGTYPDLAWALPSAEKKASLEDLVPKELGQLRKVHFPLPLDQELYRQEGLKAVLDRIIWQDSPVVILIEDAHSNVEAQMNIANLIEFIRTNYRINLLALEGAAGDAPLTEINTSPLNEGKEEVLDFYLRQALLSGPEYEALRSPESYKVRGVENMEVYESDRKIYLDVVGKRYEIDQALNTAEARLDKEKEKYYSPAFLTFDRKERYFSRNPSRYLSSFVPYLVREAGRAGLTPAESSSLSLVVRVLADSQNISLENLKKEAVQFRLSEKKFRREIQILEKRFLPRGFDFDFAVTGPPPRIPHFFLYRFPSLRAYLDLAEMRYQMDPVQMFGEIDDFALKTKGLLGKSPKELELDKRSRELELLRRILHLEAHREDVVSAEGVRELAEELDLLDSYERATLFYELAVKRDEILALNTLQAISEVASSPKAAILVAGGFHAAGIQKVLENSKVNYLVITPQFDSNLSDDRLYQMRLKDDLSLVGSAIASRRRIMLANFIPEINAAAKNRAAGMSLPASIKKARKSQEAVLKTERILKLTEPYRLVPQPAIHASSLGKEIKIDPRVSKSLHGPLKEFFETNTRFKGVKTVEMNREGERGAVVRLTREDGTQTTLHLKHASGSSSPEAVKADIKTALRSPAANFLLSRRTLVAGAVLALSAGLVGVNRFFSAPSKPAGGGEKQLFIFYGSHAGRRSFQEAKTFFSGALRRVFQNPEGRPDVVYIHENTDISLVGKLLRTALKERGRYPHLQSWLQQRSSRFDLAEISRDVDMEGVIHDKTYDFLSEFLQGYRNDSVLRAELNKSLLNFQPPTRKDSARALLRRFEEDIRKPGAKSGDIFSHEEMKFLVENGIEEVVWEESDFESLVMTLLEYKDLAIHQWAIRDNNLKRALDFYQKAAQLKWKNNFLRDQALRHQTDRLISEKPSRAVWHFRGGKHFSNHALIAGEGKRAYSDISNSELMRYVDPQGFLGQGAEIEKKRRLFLSMIAEILFNTVMPAEKDENRLVGMLSKLEADLNSKRTPEELNQWIQGFIRDYSVKMGGDMSRFPQALLDLLFERGFVDRKLYEELKKVGFKPAKIGGEGAYVFLYSPEVSFTPEEIRASSLGDEEKLIALYTPGILKGQEELIAKLKRKVVRTHELVEELGKQFGLSEEVRANLKIAALVGDLGKGFADEGLTFHYSTLRMKDMMPMERKRVRIFVEDGRKILKREKIELSRMTWVFVKAVYEDNTNAQRTLKDAGFETAMELLDLANQFSALVSAVPYERDVKLQSHLDIEDWLKKLYKQRDISSSVMEGAAPIFKAAIINKDVVSFLKPGVSKPLFHEQIIRLAQFRPLSLAAIAPLLEDPKTAHEDLSKRLDLLSRLAPQEKSEILTVFSIEFFEKMRTAYQGQDLKRRVEFLSDYENVLKKLGENEDRFFKLPRKDLLTRRVDTRARQAGLKHFVIAEDYPIYKQYLEAKIAKQNPKADILSADTGEEALEKIKERRSHDPSYQPDLLVTDNQMKVGKKVMMSGWELSRAVKQMFPQVMVLVESSFPFPIGAEVEGAISKYDLLFLEYVLDLYEKEYLDRREIKGASLGETAVQPVWTRGEIIAATQKNMETSPLPAYLFLPSSLLGKVQTGAVSSALKNPNIHLEILWDTAESPAERVERLRSLGWDSLTKDRNFHSNIANRKLDSLRSLAEKAAYQSKTLEEKGISEKQIGFLKPAALETNISGVLSLKEGAPYPVFLLLYLIQIEGSPAHDLLNIFSFDPKRGDFTAFLDKELERLFEAHFAIQVTKRAA